MSIFVHSHQENMHPPEGYIKALFGFSGRESHSECSVNPPVPPSNQTSKAMAVNGVQKFEVAVHKRLLTWRICSISSRRKNGPSIKN